MELREIIYVSNSLSNDDNLVNENDLDACVDDWMMTPTGFPSFNPKSSNILWTSTQFLVFDDRVFKKKKKWN